MHCAKCGKELEEGSKFCDGCGEKVEIEEIESEVEETADEAITEPIDEEAEEEIQEEVEEPEPEPEEPKPAPVPAAIEKKSAKTDNLRIVKPLGIFSYLWMFILMLIPVVDIIMVCVWAFGKNKNPNKKNFAWAVIIFILLGLLGWLLLGIVFVNEFEDIIDKIVDVWESIF